MKEDVTFLTEELEREAGPLFVSHRKELEEYFKQIIRNRKSIRTFCSKNPKINEKIEEWHKKTSIYAESFGLKELDTNISAIKKVDILSLLKLEQADFDPQQAEPGAMADLSAIRDACNLVSACARGKSSDVMPYTSDMSVYDRLSERLLIRVHDEMYKNLPSGDRLKIAKYRFRNAQDGLIVLPRAPFEPTVGERVSREMMSLFSLVDFTWPEAGYSPIEIAAMFAAQCWRIQPFMDGNKRVALLGANFLLEKADLNRLVLGRIQSKIFMENLKLTILKRDAYPLAKQFSEIILARQDKLIDKIRELYLDEVLDSDKNSDDEFGD